MKKLLLIPLALVILAGCMQMNMQFEPTVKLIDKYDHSVKDKNIAIYYSVKNTPSGKMLNMAVQNVAKVYMRNLTINYDECCQTYKKGSGKYNFKNLGNLKNRSHKTMQLSLKGIDEKSLKLVYKFTPVVEDSFLKRDSGNAYTPQMEDIKETIRVYTKD